eukprot:scaffold89644_cov32-Tisochrysis_lutea.AAC.2
MDPVDLPEQVRRQFLVICAGERAWVSESRNWRSAPLPRVNANVHCPELGAHAWSGTRGHAGDLRKAGQRLPWVGRRHTREELDVLLELVHRRGAEQDGSASRARAGPPQRELGEGHTCLHGKLGIGPSGLLCWTRAITVKGASPAKLVHAAARLLGVGKRARPVRVVRCRRHIKVLAREHAARKRVVCHKADVLIPWR